MEAGKLKHNEQGRYCLEDGSYFTSGEGIELLLDGIWVKGRIEYSHKHKDYYFVKEEEEIYVYNLVGVKARCI